MKSYQLKNHLNSLIEVNQVGIYRLFYLLPIPIVETQFIKFIYTYKK